MKKTILSALVLLLAISQLAAQNVYIEYKISSGGESGVSGSAKVYARNGNVRSEMTMTGPQLPNGMTRAALILKDSVKKSFILDDKNKTYTPLDLTESSARENDPSQYTITVVGKEKVNGYNATHIKVKIGAAVQEEDMWVSTEVLNYKKYISVKTQYSSDGLVKAMAAKGVEGFPVRISMNMRGTPMQVDLVKMEARDCDPALFSLAGYTRRDLRAPAAGGDAQDMMKKIQNMTPEERKQFLEQMKQNPAGQPAPKD